MSDFLLPDILRLPLDEVCLKILCQRLGQPTDVLSEAIEPPQEIAVTKALARLHDARAIDAAGALTALGWHLAAMPVDVRLGKMIIFASILGCLDPILTIAAALSFKSPFVRPFGKEAEADYAKQQLKKGGYFRNDDFLVIKLCSLLLHS
jgi:ATP-dependent RNA helicase DHX29